MIDPADLNLITAQMGRPPHGLMAIAARCPAGHPAAITTYPLRQEGSRLVPFPTIYWLTCPRLCRELAHLERDGVIAAIAAELAKDETLRTALARDHNEHIAQRWAMLAPEDRLLVSEQGLLDDFQARGIGGMADRAAVKCLHLHYACHLAGGNTIGALVAQRYNLLPCT